MAPSRLSGRRSVGVAASLALLIGVSVSGQSVLPLPASAATGSEEDPDPLPAELDESVEPGGSVPAVPTAEVDPVPEPPEPPPAPPAPEYPEAAIEELPVAEEPPAEGDAEDPPGGPGAEGADGAVAFPIAVWLPPEGEDSPDGESTEGTGQAPADVPASVTVEVLSEDAVATLGGVGLAFTVTRADGVSEPGGVAVDAVYDSFRSAAGGNFASRLELVAAPACALTTPKEEWCQQRTPVAAENQLKSGLLRAVVEAAGDPGGGSDRLGGVLQGLGLDDAPPGQIFLVTSGTGGVVGDYAASPIAPTGEWAVGIGSGDFSWTEPLPSVPLPQGGTGTPPALQYSSGSVDGRTTATNPQASWAGLGWDVATGSVTQVFEPCATSADSCYYPGAGRYALSLNGQSSDLVLVAGQTNQYRLVDDPGWQVLHYTDSSPSAWIVTTPDGSRYYFGWANSYTQSVWQRPVKNAVGVFENAPWNWSLSHVQDTSDNMTAYYYTRETNHYQSSSGKRVYDRGGHLSTIDFGRTFDGDAEASNLETGRVTFSTQVRCIGLVSTCAEPTYTSPEADYPDVPTDLLCSAAASTCEETSPAFFTTKRLSAVTSFVRQGSVFVPVDLVTLAHAFVDAYVDDADAQLWLHSVQTLGVDGDTPDVGLPAMVFDDVALLNRADAFDVWMPRVASVTLPTGGLISITYGQANPCDPIPVEMGSEADRDCFPAWGTRGNQTQDGFVWYHKYLVFSVSEQSVVGGPNPPVVETTSYAYPVDVDGPEPRPNPQIHHDDNEEVDSSMRGWSIWRGYDQVTTTKGSQIDVYRVLRGMHGDKIDEDTDLTVQITDAHNNVYYDHDWFNSRIYEHHRLNGATDVEFSTTKPDWGRLDPGNNDVTDVNTPRMVVDILTKTTVDVPGGTDRTTATETFYNHGTGGLGITYGLPDKVTELGDVAIANDERCTTMSYAINETDWVLKPASVKTFAVAGCTGSAAAQTDTLYDNTSTVGAPPLRGLPTVVRAYSNNSDYSETLVDYDEWGRATATTDPNLNTTTTDYAPEDPQFGLPSTVTVTNARTHATVTSMHPRRQIPGTVTDPNGHATKLVYDGLGRLSKVWRPTEAVTGPASMEYLYDIAAGTPPKVTSRTLQSILGTTGAGTYVPSYTYYDGLAREVQTQVIAPTGTGRVVSWTRYDAEGLVAAQTAPMHMADPAGSAFALPDLADIPSETRYNYDALGRPETTVLYSDGVPVPGMTTQTAYNGTSTTLTPAAGMPITTHLDAYGRTAKVTEHYSTTALWETDYTYDALDNLKTISDHYNNLTSYGYDKLSRRTSSDDPDTGLWTYTYDPAGNTLKTTDAKGDATLAGYDNLNRRTALHKTDALGDPGTQLASWTYDNGGRRGLLVATLSRVDGYDYKINNMTYDARNRLTAKTYVIPNSPAAAGLNGSYTFGYGYDRADHRTSVTYPNAGNLSAETVTTNFSDRGYEVSTAGSHTYVASTTYKNYGLLARRDYGGTGSLVRKYSYDTATRWLDNLTTDFNGGTPQNSAYGHDLVGNITSIDTAGTATPNECFSYDNANRLITAVTRTGTACSGPLGGNNSYNQTFEYDAIARITKRSAVGAPPGVFDDYVYPVSPTHGVKGITEHDGSGPQSADPDTSYEYDANGNRTEQATDSTFEPDVTYQWDSQHQLSHSAVTADGATNGQNYIYDADGNRLIRDDGNSRVLYLDNTEIRPAGSASVRYYTTSTGVLVGLRQGTQAWTRVILNHQGSTQYLIKNNTINVQDIEYQPYGKTRNGSTGLPTDRRYLHAPNDDATGLTQLGARYYDPKLAQFISPDPLVAPYSPQTLDGYTNAANNPVTFSDPTGLYPIEGGGEGGYNPPPGYGGYQGAPPPHYDRPPPDRWIPDGPFTGEVGENLATFQVELEIFGYIQGMPGVTDVPITAWEYHYYGVAQKVAYINATAGNQPTAQEVAWAVSFFTPGGWILKGITAGVRGLKGLQAARAANGAVRLADSGLVSPSTIRFSQNSISGSFRGGGGVKDLASGLRSGAVNPSDIPAIRLVERNGNYFSLDNRRLAAFQAAGVDIPYRMASPSEIAREGWKFTTINDGTSILIRGGG